MADIDELAQQIDQLQEQVTDLKAQLAEQSDEAMDGRVGKLEEGQLTPEAIKGALAGILVMLEAKIDAAIEKAMASSGDEFMAQTELIRASLEALNATVKALAMPVTKVGTLELPSGPVTMTITTKH